MIVLKNCLAVYLSYIKQGLPNYILFKFNIVNWSIKKNLQKKFPLV